MRGKLKWIAALVAVIGLVALIARPHPIAVDGARASSGPLRVTLDEEGRTQVKRRYTLSAPLTGKLLRIDLKAGDRVEEGAVLARLVPADAPLLDSRARAEQEARLHASEAATMQADANVQLARVNQATAESDLARKQKLAGSSAIAPRELDLAQSEAATRVQDLASAEFGAKVAAHQLTEARAALERGRSGKLDELPIVAPVSGQVLRVFRESEGVVTAGTQLLEVGDPRVLEVSAELLTVDSVQVRPGQRATIDHWGGAHPLDAQVRRIEPSGFTKVSALGVEEQRVRVLLDLVNARPEAQALGDNYRVEVHIVVWQADSVLRAPTAALFRRGDAWAAYVVADGRAQLRRIDVGHEAPDRFEVVNGGVAAGDLLVLRPGEALTDGARVAATVADGK